MTSVFSWQNSVSLCPASFCTPRPSLPVTPGISWLPTFASRSSMMKRTSFLCVLVLEDLVGLHRTIQLHLLQLQHQSFQLIFRTDFNFGGSNEDNRDLLQQIPCIYCYTHWPPTLQQATSNPHLCWRVLYTPGKVWVSHLWGHWSFPAKAGSQETLGVTGKFGLGVQNEAGQRLTEFCQEGTQVIANTLFQQYKRQMANTKIRLIMYFAA